MQNTCNRLYSDDLNKNFMTNRRNSRSKVCHGNYIQADFLVLMTLLMSSKIFKYNCCEIGLKVLCLHLARCTCFIWFFIVVIRNLDLGRLVMFIYVWFIFGSPNYLPHISIFFITDLLSRATMIIKYQHYENRIWCDNILGLGKQNIVSIIKKIYRVRWYTKSYIRIEC